jgi:polar amino acid transport system substrate-binding protein
MMMSRLAIAPAVAALVAAATAASAQTVKTLTFCAGTDNLPLSHPGSGIEVEFARALAPRIGAEARFTWLDAHEESFEQAVLDGRCDAALGAIVDPGPMAGDRTLPGVKLSDPYYAAGYLLVRRVVARPVRTLEEIGDSRIAVEMVSIPVYTLRQRGLGVYALRDSEAVIQAVADGRAEYGYLWGPLTASLLRDRNDVVLVKEFEPEERWSFALALRASGGELLDAVNAAIGEMVREGEMERIFARYGVPFLRPTALALQTR